MCCERAGSCGHRGLPGRLRQPTWHEVRGEGPAVVLLHGAFSGAAGWMAQAPALVSAGFRVHVPERRGHGHTRDVEGPLTYEVMAADTVAYLEAEAGGHAHLVGWSDGAVVALLWRCGDRIWSGAWCSSASTATPPGGCRAATLTGCCIARKPRTSSGRVTTGYLRMDRAILRLSMPRR